MKLKKGKVSLEKIVNILGTATQKNSFKKNKRLVGNNKKVFFDKLERYCDFEDLGEGNLNITNIFNFPKPVGMNKLTNGLFKYIAPLILIELINNSNENQKINLTILKWAMSIDMVNKNYQPVKYNKNLVGEYMEIDMEIMYEFFEKVDSSMEYYIEKCLNYLKKADVLEWFPVPMLNKRKVTRGSNTDGDMTLNCENERVRASDEELKFIFNCSEIARKEFGIKEKKECFFGSKAQEYKEKLSVLLKQRDILYKYISYEVYYTNKERCESLLDEFEFKDKYELIMGFNQEFINMMVSNAEKRQVKELANSILKEYRVDESYISGITTLSNLTIPRVCDTNIYKELKLNESYIGNMNKKLYEDFSIKLVNKNIK